ncbi:MAG: hypothetical protein KKG76_09745 [Euryarchaeota archaeon]|nr:hypothetical protein [Euryarchaeota archaeon]
MAVSPEIYLGLLAVIVFAIHLYESNRIHQQELKFQKLKHEDQLKQQEKENELLLKQFEENTKEREKRDEWLDRQTTNLAGVTEKIGDKIAMQLKENVDWAVSALEQAKLKPRAQTLFGERMGHFRDEKEHIAENFVPLLLKRCKFHAEKGKVYLIVDAGTTLFPFFERLGRETVRIYENKEPWLSNLEIITNNLPGIETLIETGRINPNNRYSKLAVECKLLPGAPLPIYSGITGLETNDALERLRKAPGGAVFIGLITGNWIRLNTSTSPNCPVPLARGQGHLGFKQVLIDNSDEIYVVTPLGKIFVDIPNDKDPCNTINKALDFNENHLDPDKQPYLQVKIDSDKAKNLKLVSTYRVDGRVLYKLSQKLFTLFNLDENDNNKDVWNEQFSKSEYHNVPHILFPFDKKLSGNRDIQIETEFPHRNTQREDFITKFFFVPPTQKP